MGLTFRLQDIAGNVEAEGIGDPRNCFRRILPPLEDESFQCLRFIDPYGDTVFNHLQARQVLKELDRIQPLAVDPEAKEVVSSIRELAEAALKGVHLYLKFLGD